MGFAFSESLCLDVEFSKSEEACYINFLLCCVLQSRPGKPEFHAKALADSNTKGSLELRKEVLSLAKRAENAEEKVSEFREKVGLRLACARS